MDLLSEINLLREQLIAGNYNSRIDTYQLADENREIGKTLNLILEECSKEIQRTKENSYNNAITETKEIFSEYSKGLGYIAAGDFSKDLRLSLPKNFPQELKKDVESISLSVSKIKDNFQALSQFTKKELDGIFSEITKRIEELSENINQAGSDVLDVAHSSEQVARNSKAVSENTEQSDAGVRQVLRAMEDLSVTVGDVSQKAESVSRLALDGTQMSRNGSERAKKAEEGMLHIITSTEEADNLISEMQGDMKKINDIVKLITDIANQTNLLALNAAIEAARAGEAGRGFAVVASEVKALALESRKSADKITDMIGSLQKQSQKAVNAVSLATEAVREGNVLLSDTLGIFGNLAEAVEEISSNIEQVASMNEEQAAAVEEITSSMHEVSAMLKDTAKEADESASATDNTSKAVGNLKIKIDKLSDISKQITDVVVNYNI